MVVASNYQFMNWVDLQTRAKMQRYRISASALGRELIEHPSYVPYFTRLTEAHIGMVHPKQCVVRTTFYYLKPLEWFHINWENSNCIIEKIELQHFSLFMCYTVKVQESKENVRMINWENALVRCAQISQSAFFFLSLFKCFDVISVNFCIMHFWLIIISHRARAK